MIEHKEISIDEINFLNENPRDITDEDLKNLCVDIESDPNFLYQRPSLINFKDGRYYCYAGSQRVKAQKLLGRKTAICFVEDNVPDKVQKERMLKDNLHRGKWNQDKLLDLDFELPELKEFGFTDIDLNIMDELEYPDEFTAPKKDNPPTLKLIFKDSKQLSAFERDLKTVLSKNLYQSITYSISQGEI